LSAQHLRPLFAFVVVAIVGAVVFATSFRAQDVVDAIRGGASDVIAGTPLLHDPLYVVEDGQRLDAAEVPEPEADSSADAGSAPVGDTVDGTVPSADAATPVPTPAAGSAGTQPAGQGTTGGGGGTAPAKAPQDSPAVPKAPTTSKGHGPGLAPGNQGSGGSGGPPPVAQQDDDHGKGDHEAKEHGRPRADDHPGHGHGHGDGDGRREARDDEGHRSGHGGSGHGPAKGHDKADHGQANGKAKGHAKANHGKAKGHDKAKGHGRH
jgi:hypothetical protein